MRRPLQRLNDMLEAIEKIQRVVGVGERDGEAAFQHDEMLRVWVYHHLGILGEAASNLPREVRTHHPGVPWGKIVATRNRAMHGYFDMDPVRVWEIAVTDLPPLKIQIEAIIEELRREGVTE
ncbi:MAG: DUF86 domain-containing protein [Actinobacteria bacterium]|nr:DUF86 domain-containing protein [Actinomycetota bacterium]